MQPIDHIDQTLPGAGAWTAAAHFAIPPDWTGLTFLVAYTAVSGSTNARPQWRISWNDGTNEFIQPVESSTIDTTGAPIATRLVYQLTDQWPSAVAAMASIHVPVGIRRMPGVPQVRLDVAELGDTANPGDVVVTIVGG